MSEINVVFDGVDPSLRASVINSISHLVATHNTSNSADGNDSSANSTSAMTDEELPAQQRYFIDSSGSVLDVDGDPAFRPSTCVQKRRRRPKRIPMIRAASVVDQAHNATPGVLSGNLRHALGIGPYVPAPYIDRMKWHGPPPAYFGVTRDHSTVVIGGEAVDVSEPPVCDSIDIPGLSTTIGPVNDRRPPHPVLCRDTGYIDWYRRASDEKFSLTFLPPYVVTFQNDGQLKVVKPEQIKTEQGKAATARILGTTDLARYYKAVTRLTAKPRDPRRSGRRGRGDGHHDHDRRREGRKGRR